jgi:hypothetical protein
MKRKISILAFALLSANIFAQQTVIPPLKPEQTEDWSRIPKMVTPGKNNNPPSDAIILYRGVSDTAKWKEENGRPIRWIANDSLTCVPRSASIITKQSFGDCQLHVEWRTPVPAVGTSQGRGNSGIFPMTLYEVQVLDSWDNETYPNGQAGSIYKQYIPLVNASTPPGTWQTYDIIFTAPRFDPDSTLIRPGYMTVIHNGVLIQNHVELKGPTGYIGLPKYKYHGAKLPLLLQNHTNPVSYRNIWIREL